VSVVIRVKHVRFMVVRLSACKNTRLTADWTVPVDW
jgi:hypothetical protein